MTMSLTAVVPTQTSETQNDPIALRQEALSVTSDRLEATFALTNFPEGQQLVQQTVALLGDSREMALVEDLLRRQLLDRAFHAEHSIGSHARVYTVAHPHRAPDARNINATYLASTENGIMYVEESKTGHLISLSDRLWDTDQDRLDGRVAEVQAFENGYQTTLADPHAPDTIMCPEFGGLDLSAIPQAADRLLRRLIAAVSLGVDDASDLVDWGLLHPTLFHLFSKHRISQQYPIQEGENALPCIEDLFETIQNLCDTAATMGGVLGEEASGELSVLLESGGRALVMQFVEAHQPRLLFAAQVRKDPRMAIAIMGDLMHAESKKKGEEIVSETKAKLGLNDLGVRSFQ